MEFGKLIFVSGKGGTGKTTVAALLARQLGQKETRTLLVELGSTSSLQAFLSWPQKPTAKPQSTKLGFDHCLLQGKDCLVEYISHFTRLEGLTQKVFQLELLNSLINVAPGLNDLSILGKLTSHFRNHGPSLQYDHIIVDAPSTGSFQSMIQSPKTLGESVSRGPLHSQSLSIDDALKNPKWVQYFFLTYYEELPMDELIETLELLGQKYPNQVSLIANKVLDEFDLRGTDPIWRQGISKKMEIQREQKKRFSNLDCPHYEIPLLLQPLSEAFEQQTGEFLRHI